MKQLIRQDLPVGVEAAAIRFAAACKRDGVEQTVDLMVSHGTPDILHFNGEVYMFQDGHWYVHEEVM